MTNNVYDILWNRCRHLAAAIETKWYPESWIRDNSVTTH